MSGGSAARSSFPQVECRRTSDAPGVTGAADRRNRDVGLGVAHLYRDGEWPPPRERQAVPHLLPAGRPVVGRPSESRSRRQWVGRPEPRGGAGRGPSQGGAGRTGGGVRPDPSILARVTVVGHANHLFRPVTGGGGSRRDPVGVLQRTLR